MATGEAEEIDLEGAFMMHGIHDVHLPPLEAATDNFQFILDDSIEAREEYADLIILDKNIFEIAPNQIGNTKVLVTYLQGELIHER